MLKMETFLLFSFYSLLNVIPNVFSLSTLLSSLFPSLLFIHLKFIISLLLLSMKAYNIYRMKFSLKKVHSHFTSNFMITSHLSTPNISYDRSSISLAYSTFFPPCPNFLDESSHVFENTFNQSFYSQLRAESSIPVFLVAPKFSYQASSHPEVSNSIQLFWTRASL